VHATRITPASGGYFAFASAAVGSASPNASLSIRVNGVNVIDGFAVGQANSTAIAYGVIVPTGSQAVEVWATISGTTTVSEGRLVLVKIA
jgi:hypothetical protein